VLIHSNDRHGYIEAREDLATKAPVAGADVEMSLLRGLKRKALMAGEPYLLVDAGDIFQGTPVVNETKGACMVDLLGSFGFHLITFGNHEFDYGWPVLLERMKESRFLWVSSTVDAPVLESHYRPWVTWDLGWTRVGFLGATTTTTPEKQLEGRLGSITFRDPLAALPPLVRRLREDHGVGVVVLLSHLGEGDDERVAAAVPGIDLIVGGHSHSTLREPRRVGSTWIVQTGASARYVGEVAVTVGDDRRVAALEGRLHEVDRLVHPADPVVAAKLQGYTEELDRRLGVVVGRATAPVDKGICGASSPLAQLAAEAFREAAGAEIGIMNFGGGRAELAAGPVTLKHIFTALPFGNYVTRFEMTGAEIRSALEENMRRNFIPIPDDQKELFLSRGLHGDLEGLVPERGQGGFIVGAGLRFLFDPRRPEAERLLEVEALGRPLDPDRVYTVATNDFLAAGGDGFSQFGALSGKVELSVLDAEALRAYFERHGEVVPPDQVSAVNLSFPSVAAVASPRAW
jgi:2',3'-cyclic-nucleotide 2'-phosphodiesterase (5'-nucleotidase family)